MAPERSNASPDRQSSSKSFRMIIKVNELVINKLKGHIKEWALCQESPSQAAYS